MLTAEQANQLANEGLLSWQRGTVSMNVELTSLIEYLVCARALVDKAINNGKLQSPWRTSTERYRYMLEAAGVLRLAIQHHGVSDYNTWQLRRALHPQQANVRSELLSQEFVVKEAAEAYKEAFDAANTNQPICVDTWKKLKSCLERLGVQFS